MSKARELSELGDKITVDGSGNSAFTGNISAVNVTVSGTVDGRDVAADGTKLDGIESGATADQTASEILTAIKTVDGAGSGLDADSLDGKQLATIETEYQSYADTAVSNLVAAAPTTLDTLNELAAALGDDPNFATTVTNSIATKLPLAGGTMTGNITFNSTQLFDGRDVSADGAKLDGIEAGATADQTITAGSGLTGGGTGNVTLSHADTSSQASVNNTGNTFIQDVTLDGFGHVTGLASATVTSANDSTITVAAGSGMTGGGAFTTNQSFNETVTLSHADTSSQGSVNNSGATVIQDVTVDTYGHVTGLGSKTLSAGDIGAAGYDAGTSSTGYFALPSGTTAQRPATPSVGMVRYNTTESEYEVYSAAGWQTLVRGNYPYTIEYLIVAGGGAAGGNRSGGGGAGGVVSGSQVVTSGTFTVTVGAGGTGSQFPSNGNDSSLTGATTAIGGGRGSGADTGSPSGSGGSGGGGAANNWTAAGSGTSGQGNSGGNGVTNLGGGGGGRGAAGAAGNSGGGGGVGTSSFSAWGAATGTGENSGGTYYYAGGGGGGVNGDSSAQAQGGLGGGGNGQRGTTIAGENGAANTGGGAGGSGGTTGVASGDNYNGGSGIVIIRYSGGQKGTGGTVTSSGGYTYHTFTSSGIYTA